MRVSVLDELVEAACAELNPEAAEAKKKQADILIELASPVELFHDGDDVGYARFALNDHQEAWPLRSKGFKRWLIRSFYETTQSAPCSEAMQQALGVLESKAQFGAPEHEVCVRVAGLDDRIYLDLANRDWQAVEIDKDGWRVVDNPPVYFRRSSGMKPLPEPVRVNDKTGEALNNDLRPLLNVKGDDEFVLNVAWLLGALHPAGPYPIHALAGEHGGGKSLRQRFMRATVDPNSVLLKALPRSEHDLYIQARNNHVLAYDNASGIPDWLSDAFCRLSTGGGFSTRELYTDQDEILFGGKRPILLNGIDDTATRADFADRSIVQTAGEIAKKDRKREKELWAKFEQKRPRILGALLDAVSHGLKALSDVALDDMPRMADFAAWVTACEGALWKKGTFMAAYAGNIEEAVQTVLDKNEIADVLRKCMDKKPEGFEGTASDLLEALNDVASQAQQKAKRWPKNHATLGTRLRRIASPLRKIGIDITFPDRKNTRRTIIISTLAVESRRKTLSPLSSLSQPNGDKDLAGDSVGIGAVTDGEIAVTNAGAGDSKEGGRDSKDFSAVTPNPMKHKGSDSSDGSDGILPRLSARRGEGISYGVLGPALPGATLKKPPVKVPEPPPDPADEDGAPRPAPPHLDGRSDNSDANPLTHTGDSLDATVALEKKRLRELFIKAREDPDNPFEDS